MKYARRLFITLCLASAVLPAVAQQPIRIGDIFALFSAAQGTDGWRKGWELAVEEINAAGGVLGGRKIEVLARDNAESPGCRDPHGAGAGHQ